MLKSELTLTYCNSVFNVHLFQSQELILQVLTLKVKYFLKLIYDNHYSIKKRPKGQNGIAWQRPTLAERKSDYHRR